MKKSSERRRLSAFEDGNLPETINAFNTFGELLRYLRRRAGLTQRALGMAVGYTETQITRLEKGQRQPDVTMVKSRFIEALHLQNDAYAAERLLALAQDARRRTAMLAHVQPNVAHAHLPAQVTAFVGRARELADVQMLLEHHRLITLTGTGGVGKTRLAIELALSQIRRLDHRVWFVDLAALSEPTFIANIVAESLGLNKFASDQPHNAIADFLEVAPSLLILDNCEHLVTACAELTTWLLRNCPKLTMLATSRETLHVSGEMVYRVQPLDTPPASGFTLDPAAYSSVHLFVSCARLSHPGFALTAANTPHVMRLCARLDGIPLAIELAAAQMRVLSIEHIVERMEQSLQSLADSRRSPLPRHQALWATLDWSYTLLPEPERQLFHRLSVFDGTFSLEAAESIASVELAGAQAPALDEDAVFVGLASLIEKSLVTPVQRDDEMRYRMLDTVRSYGRAKLAQFGEAEAMDRAHLHYFLRFAQTCEPLLFLRLQAQALKDLDAEYGNIRAALNWAIEHGEAEAGLQLAGLLWVYWLSRAYSLEGCELTERLLQLQAPVRPAIRARALLAVANVRLHTREFSRITEYADEAASLLDAVDDELSAVMAALMVAMSKTLRGEYAHADEAYETCKTQFMRLRNEWAVMLASHMQGFTLLLTSEIERARQVIEQALTIANALEDTVIRPWLIAASGFAALKQGDIERAESMFDHATRLWQGALGDSSVVTVQQAVIGFGAEMIGLPDYAGEVYRRVLLRRRELGGTRYLSESFESIAGLAALQGDSARAVRLLGCAATLRRAEVSFWVSLSRVHALLEKLRRQMGEPAFSIAWDEGRLMTTDQAIDYALE